MKLKRIAHKAYNALDGIFTDQEAWGLFRLAAFAETFGWTCLIIGIIAVEAKWPHDTAYIAVAESIHGILYLFYLFIVIFGHRAMKWSIWRFIFAELVSVIPYGALAFEIWVSIRRRNGKV